MQVKLINFIGCFALLVTSAFSQSVPQIPNKTVSKPEVATVEICFSNPLKHYISTPEPKSDADLYSLFRKTSKTLKNEEKLFVFAYSEGSFGTTGLQLMTGAVKSHAEYILKSEKRFEVIEGGYRDEASIEVFVLGKKCARLVESEYKGDPSIELSQVDFVDAPLGLSVFPNASELDELTVKSVEGGCHDCYAFVIFDVIVGTNGRVLLAHPADIDVKYFFDPGNPKAKIIVNPKDFSTRARNTLDQWVFQTPVVDGVPRFIRGNVVITF